MFALGIINMALFLIEPGLSKLITGENIMSKNFKLAVLFAAIAGSMAAMAPAQATVITNWNYTVNSGFSAFAPAGVTPSATNTALGLPSTLTWGTSTGSGQSSLTFGGVNGMQTGAIATGAAPINTVIVTEINRPITGTELTSATLQDRLTLDPVAPIPPAVAGPGDQFNLAQLSFNILFNETTNTAPCAIPSSPTPCNDIFVLSLTSGSGAFFNATDPSNVFLSQPFAFLGENYTVNVFLDGLVVLPNTACASMTPAQANGCIGFSVSENSTNNFQVRLQILSAPEPITLSLFGAGLIGAAAIRRRKSK